MLRIDFVQNAGLWVSLGQKVEFELRYTLTVVEAMSALKGWMSGRPLPDLCHGG